MLKDGMTEYKLNYKRLNYDYSWFSRDVRKKTETSSNHRLESAGLNALEELLFKMLGMGRLVCKGNYISK